MNHVDTVWILIATALVFFMTIPGLTLFYGGMVRARNVVNMFMQCFATACLMVVLWYAAGYSIAYGDGNGYWGGIGKMFLNGVSLESTVGTLPEILFFAFQHSGKQLYQRFAANGCTHIKPLAILLYLQIYIAAKIWVPLLNRG